MKKFEYYIGIDISKLTLDVTLLSQCDNSTKTVHYKIENSQKGIAQLVRDKLGCYLSEQMLFCFEDTGIYGVPLACFLSDNQFNYWQVPAVEIKRSKGITRGKDDETDSKDIAFYAYSNMHKFKPSFMPSHSILQLKLLFTEREKLLKSAGSLEKTSENETFIPKDVFSVVKSTNRLILKQINKAIKTIEDKIMEIINLDEKLSQQHKVLTSIPGIGMQTATYLIIVTKGFESFDNWRQLACYAGVAPFPYQSGTSIKGRNKVHPLADKKLKALLNMCAICAVRYDQELKTYYERKIAEGKSKMLVVNNVRCKLLARVFAVVNRETPFVNTSKFAF